MISLVWMLLLLLIPGVQNIALPLILIFVIGGAQAFQTDLLDAKAGQAVPQAIGYDQIRIPDSPDSKECSSCRPKP